MAVVLKIYDGSTTLNLNDLTNYALPADDEGAPLWAPTIPGLSFSPLGESGPYADTIEEIRVHVRGSTGANALDALADLIVMLDDTAVRGGRGEAGVSPVQIHYRPHNSSLGADVKAIILGPVDGEDHIVTLPTTINRADNKEIGDVVLRFRVRWKWIGADDTWTITAAVDIGDDVLMLDATTLQAASPFKLTISGFNPSTTPSLTAGLLLVGAAVLDVVPELMTASKYTSVADTTNKAKNSNVLRYTPTDTAFNMSGSSPTMGGDARQWLVYATVRNNSGSATWRVRLVQVALGKTIYGPEVAIDASSTTPRIVCLGVMAGLDSSTNQQFAFKLDIAASTTSGSPTLDFDEIYVLPVTDDHVCKAIQFEAGSLVGAFGAGSTSVSLVVDDRALTELQPVISAVKVSTGDRLDLGYKTSPLLISRGVLISACLIMVGGNSSAHWRFTNSSGTVVQVQYQVVLHQGYIFPP